MAKAFTLRQIMKHRGRNVAPAEHKRVWQFAGRCRRELSKAEYELPPLVLPMEVTTKHRGQSSNGGAAGICIDLWHVRRGARHFNEYRSYAGDRLIGSLQGEPWALMEAVVAHEVAHHVQFAYGRRMRESWRRDMRKPHGPGFRRIYCNLRRALINHRPEVEQYEGPRVWYSPSGQAYAPGYAIEFAGAHPVAVPR
jgi:hypothetical protein